MKNICVVLPIKAMKDKLRARCQGLHVPQRDDRKMPMDSAFTLTPSIHKSCVKGKRSQRKKTHVAILSTMTRTEQNTCQT